MLDSPGSTRFANYFPTPRDEVVDRLRNGDLLLQREMQGGERHFRKGHRLARMGEPQDTIYRLVAGIVARTRLLSDGRRQIVCFFTPGDLIAVRAVLSERLPDNIETLSTATVNLLGCRTAIELASRHCDVAFRLMWQLAEDERRLRNNAVMLAKGTAKQRIATMIVDLLGRRAVAAGSRDPEQSVVISLRQQDIADHVGLTLVHVNRTLRALREAGILDVSVGAIAIRNHAALSAYAAPMLDIYEQAAPEFGGRP